MNKYIFFLIIFLFCRFTLIAENLHLNSGESLQGKIRLMDEKILYLESNLTSKELKINRSEINQIEFDSTARSLARRIGLGFHYRLNGNGENLAVKNWLSEVDSAELIVGYSSDTEDYFKFELRYARVFSVKGNNDLFYGVGTGVISKDSTSGTLFRVFSGNEYFPISSPNFSISLELGFLLEQVSNNDYQGLYNGLSARYYF